MDFGIHVADNKTIYKTITVTNSGSTPAPYRIDYRGEHPIGFSPQSAMVQPNSAVVVEVHSNHHPRISLSFFILFQVSLLTASTALVNDIAT